MSQLNTTVLRRLCGVLLLVVAVLAPSSSPAEGDGETMADFSRTNSVSLPLTESSRGRDRWRHGLAHAFWEKDGRTTAMTVEGVPCRNLSLSGEGRSKGYFYFALDHSFKQQDVSKVRIDVDYFDGFDGQHGVFGLQYDASAAGGAPQPSSKALLPMVALNGSGKWLKASFHVRDATFENAQNARSDFRLVASPPELSVSRVTVTLEPEMASPPVPLKFDEKGEAKLRDWNVQWDTGSQPSFARGTNGTDGIRWMEVRASGSRSVGSWRTSVLLEPGNYQLLCRAELTGVKAGGEPSGEPSDGAMLRASGKSGYKMVAGPAGWTLLDYDFVMTTQEYVELVCDFRGSHGSVRFDVDSLKLIRKADGTK